MLAGEFDISVPNVLGFYVAKAKAKEGLTSLKFQGLLPLPQLALSLVNIFQERDW